MTMRDRTFHYVPHHAALDWLRTGWIVVRKAGIFPHHDQYCVTMEWLCDCKLARPR
jgi:hypothetical protein